MNTDRLADGRAYVTAWKQTLFQPFKVISAKYPQHKTARYKNQAACFILLL
jgi:hypothetical protein